MTLTPQWLDELRARTILSALIGKSIKITRAGREYKACCPFHNEKTPSFTINDDKGFYHCFGCGAHGDAIRWMTDQRGLPFMDAVKELAASAGMDVPAPDPRAAARAEQAVSLRDVTEASASWFRERLADGEGAEARAYLAKRGLTQQTIAAFGLGYAPDARGRLREVLNKFGDPLAIESGMLIQPQDDSSEDSRAGLPAGKARQKREPYDRFRGRLMIPIRDARGRTIAFGGRILGPGEPKYLNSPDTPLFDKGRTLYNLDRAAPAARKSGRLIVVEGYMDVIALAQAGIEEAVAPLGTALTENQIELAWRQVPVPILAFDGDAAGQRAALRAATRALPLLRPGHSLSFLTLPAGQDPDDIVRSGGAAAFDALAASPMPLAQILYRNEAAAHDVTLPEGRAALVDELNKKSSIIQNDIVSKQYRKWFSDRFYGDFGWKKNNLLEIKNSTENLVNIKDKTIEMSIFRSILFGLVQRPEVALSHIEIISSLQTHAKDMELWREAVVDQIISRPNTREDGFDQMVKSSLGLPRRFSEFVDLVFPWNKSKLGYERHLGDALDLVNFEAEYLLEMQRIDEQLLSGGSDDLFYALRQRMATCTEQLTAVRGAMFSMFDTSTLPESGKG